jgi:hypothetical protein
MYQYHQQRPTPHYLFDVAQDKMWDQSAVNIFGFNTLVGTSFETLWNDGGAYVFPSSAVAMDLVSTSASDTMDVLVVGLDSSYNQITETVTLTGTSAVTTSASFLRVNSAIILSGQNAGEISISNGGTTYAFIGTNLGTTQACIYTVPAGYSLYIFRIDFNSATVNPNKYLTVRNKLSSHTGRVLHVAEATFSTSQVSYDRQVPFKIAEKTDFEFQAKSSSSDNEVAVFVECVLIKN